MEDITFEFFKLDLLDRQVLFWKMSHFPQTIPSWIEYVVNDYKKNRSIEIDSFRLTKEVLDALQDFYPNPPAD